jgi:hypothetical protein
MSVSVDLLVTQLIYTLSQIKLGVSVSSFNFSTVAQVLLVPVLTL